MKNWILSIVSLIFFVLIISIFLPESKLGKYARSIISIFILIVTIEPFVSNKQFNLKSEQSFNKELSIQTDYLNFINDYKVEKIEEGCNEILLSLGISNAKIFIEYEMSDNYEFLIKKVNLNLSESVINSSKPHKYIIDDIKIEISQKMRINKDLIVVYE